MIENGITNINIEYNEIDNEINIKCNKNDIDYANKYKIQKKKRKI